MGGLQGAAGALDGLAVESSEEASSRVDQSDIPYSTQQGSRDFEGVSKGQSLTIGIAFPVNRS